MRHTGSRWIALAIPVGLFVLSCFMVPGHGHGGHLEDGYEPVGWRLLVYGWGWFAFGLPGFAWLANPLFLLSFAAAAARSYCGAALFAGLTLLCALIPLFAFAQMVDDIRIQWPSALLAVQGRLEMRLGYFVWLASHASLLAFATWTMRQENHSRNPEAAP